MTDPADSGRPAVIFDLGGVLIDWDPRHLYRKLFDGEGAAMEAFLSRICSPAWNAQMDRGKPFAEAVAELSAIYPEHEELIAAYHGRWEEMIGGSYEPAVAVLAEVRQAGYPLYALSNWSAETFPLMRRRYEFLSWFDSITLSGEVGSAKPETEIYRVALARIGRLPGDCLFIDDSLPNIATADDLGFQTIHYVSAEKLRRDLVARGLLPGFAGSG